MAVIYGQNNTSSVQLECIGTMGNPKPRDANLDDRSLGVVDEPGVWMVGALLSAAFLLL